MPPTTRAIVPGGRPGNNRRGTRQEANVAMRGANSLGETMAGMLSAPITDRGAWRRQDIRTEDYLVPLSPSCLDEIRRALDALRANPLPTVLLDPAEFTLPACRQAMGAARRILDTGVRFALVDRLPLDEMSLDEAKAIYWLLASLVARPVAQSLDTTMMYDVPDTDRIPNPGPGCASEKPAP